MMIFGHSLLEVGVFCALVIGCLWYDLHSHDDSKPVTAKSAAKWTAIWVSLAFAFAAYIGFTEGTDQMQLFIAGYLLEESLSVDNLFVMMAIFTSFGIKDAYQHRVLYYGILGAVIMRLAFVAAGSGLIKLFGPYALGAFGFFILWTAFKMFQGMNKHWHMWFAQLQMPTDK